MKRLSTLGELTEQTISLSPSEFNLKLVKPALKYEIFDLDLSIMCYLG